MPHRLKASCGREPLRQTQTPVSRITAGSCQPTPSGYFVDGHAEYIDVVAELEKAGNGDGPYPVFGTDTRNTVFDAMQ